MERRDGGINKRRWSSRGSLLPKTNHPTPLSPSYDNSLLLYRLPSPSIHWDQQDDLKATTICPTQRCDIDMAVPKPALTSKRSFTVDRLANLCSQLQEESTHQHEDLTCSPTASARSITPVPSLVFSQSSCSTDTEPNPAVSPTMSPRCKLATSWQQPVQKHTKSLSQPVLESQPAEHFRREASGARRSQASCPSLSTFEFHHYQLPSVQRRKVALERPLPPLPSEAKNVPYADEISYIDWDSDDDDNSNQFSKVHSVIKKSIADFRPSSRTALSSHIQRKEYGALKLGLSVVLENPSAAAVLPNSTMMNRFSRSRNLTCPESYSTPRYTSIKPGASQRSTIVGYEKLSPLPVRHTSVKTNPQKPLESPRCDSAMNWNEDNHRDKRRRLSKLSQWVKSRVSSS